MVNYINIFELLKERPDTVVSLRVGDLGHFAEKIVERVRQEFEREREIKAQEADNDLLTPEEVKDILTISGSTLYRLSKSGILVPKFVGGQRRYARVDVDRMLEGR